MNIIILKNKKIILLAASLVAIITLSTAQAQQSSKAGTGVYEAVVNTNDGHIYVTSAGSRSNPGGAIYKIHPESLNIVDSILLKENPPFGIGINNKTNIAYTTNTRTNSVSAVDLKNGKLIATFNNNSEKSHLREVIVDEEKNLIYVSNFGEPSDIWMIDGNTNSVLKTINNTGNSTTGIAFNGQKTKIYTTNMKTNEIVLIDIASGKVENSFPSGGESPINLVVDAGRIFVANQKSGTVTVLDASTGNLIKSIATGAGTIGIAYDIKSNKLYAANRQTGTTTVIDGDSYTILTDVKTGSHPNQVKVDPPTGVAYVINKTKSVRPVEGQPAPPIDNNGDTITKIK